VPNRTSIIGGSAHELLYGNAKTVVLSRDLEGHHVSALGQHSDEILGGELGLSAEELADLRAEDHRRASVVHVTGDEPH
jgi:hypothetical protein